MSDLTIDLPRKRAQLKAYQTGILKERDAQLRRADVFKAEVNKQFEAMVAEVRKLEVEVERVNSVLAFLDDEEKGSSLPAVEVPPADAAASNILPMPITTPAAVVPETATS